MDKGVYLNTAYEIAMLNQLFFRILSEPFVKKVHTRAKLSGEYRAGVSIFNISLCGKLCQESRSTAHQQAAL